MTTKHTPGPWSNHLVDDTVVVIPRRPLPQQISALGHSEVADDEDYANARLIAAAPDLLEALREARRAIGDHYAPNDCYATGPLTGDPIRDLVQCPACSAIAMFDAAIAKATGEQQ